MKQNYFITLHPHQTNLNSQILFKDLRNAICMYYRNTLGKNFNKQRDKQFPISIFIEYGKRRTDYKSTHIHFTASGLESEIKDFNDFIANKLKEKYSSLTNAIKEITDWNGLMGYLNKEGNEIYVNQDLYYKTNF